MKGFQFVCFQSGDKWKWNGYRTFSEGNTFYYMPAGSKPNGKSLKIINNNTWQKMEYTIFTRLNDLCVI